MRFVDEPLSFPWRQPGLFGRWEVGDERNGWLVLGNRSFLDEQGSFEKDSKPGFRFPKMLKGRSENEKASAFDSELDGFKVKFWILVAQRLAMLLGFLFGHLSRINFEARSLAVWLEEVPAFLCFLFKLDCVHTIFSRHEITNKKSRKLENSRLS
jgi:hypothetical protein